MPDPKLARNTPCWAARWPLALSATLVALYAAPASADERTFLRASGPGVPVVKEGLTVHIDHRYAVTDHRQIAQNETGRQTEAAYLLSAGSGAIATKFGYWNGDDEIKGELFERAPAKQMYDAVTRVRRDPGLLEELAPGTFRYRIFPFAAGEMKRIDVRWESWLVAHGRFVEYRAPLANPRTSVVVDLAAAGTLITSDTHEIEVEKLPRGVTRVKTLGARSDRPDTFSLRYDLAQAPVAPFTHVTPAGEAFVVLDYATPDAQLDHVAFDVDNAAGVQLASPLPAIVVGERFQVAFRCRPRGARGTLHTRLTAELGGRPVTLAADVDLSRTEDKPWAETLWAATRARHLEAHPNGSGARDEAIELELGHEMASPHTAFFAIPASEAGRVQGQLADARRRKRWLTADATDAIAPGAGSPAPMSDAPVPPPPTLERTAMAPPSEHARGGCAGCTVKGRGSSASAPALLAVLGAVALLIGRLRRRRE
jgi:hypothetical protein